MFKVRKKCGGPDECQTTRPVDNSDRDKSARKRGQVGPYVKTTRTVLLFYNIVQYLSSRYVFSFYPFYFDFHSTRIIFDVSSGFYLWNVNRTTT